MNMRSIATTMITLGLTGCCFGGLPTPGATGPGTAPPIPGAGPTVSIGPGFMPDPQTATGTAGGPIAAQTMSPECRGYLASAPNHVLNATGVFMNLRVIVGSGQDLTLVIQRPDGSFLCNDDFEGLNPGVAAPFQPGQYRVWVGAYSPTAVGTPYTIAFTELPTVTAASLGGGGVPGLGGLGGLGALGAALIPQECGMSAAAPNYGPIVIGSTVMLGAHTPWTGPDGNGGVVTLDSNWAEEMARWVGQRTTVTGLEGVDAAGCPGVHVAADAGHYFWRIRNMTF